ncbi:MAG TPA: 3'(2'),5'-bisphosphate nucleotidase CysQ [Methylomirabilota bacterium]|nr:3'(2'),5'-bisphosphate nucleotidase CysQ [Methylomirabilota bacterium]
MDRALLATLLAVARSAAESILDVYDRPFDVQLKRAREPVTAADRRANALICAALVERFPDVPIVAEESDPETFRGFRSAPRVFFVDPLDGTREFIARNGEFAVMIGLLDGARALAGAVHAPVAAMSWIGAPGIGAWRVDGDGPWVPVQVSPETDLGRARLVASRSHRSVSLQRALAALGGTSVRALGSAGLKGAEVAQGTADAYVDTGPGTKRWDACAIDALVTAAGGRVTDTRGVPIDYRGPDLANRRGLLVTNGLLHDAILTRLGSSPGF